jgi:hypothetical protein
MEDVLTLRSVCHITICRLVKQLLTKSFDRIWKNLWNNFEIHLRRLTEEAQEKNQITSQDSRSSLVELQHNMKPKWQASDPNVLFNRICDTSVHIYNVTYFKLVHGWGLRASGIFTWLVVGCSGFETICTSRFRKPSWILEDGSYVLSNNVGNLTLSNPIILPATYSPALIYFGRERGWWITCNYPTVLKEKNINRNRKSTAWTICWLKSVLHEEKCREQENHNIGCTLSVSVFLS